MEEKKLWDGSLEEALQTEINTEILSAIEEAEKNGPPPVETLFDDVFAELPPHLREQKEYLLDYRSRNPRTEVE